MEHVLKKYFGFAAFRPYQEDVIRQVVSGRDCLVVMATGSGKSLCYQIPPLVTNKTAIVISPLIALMQDQVMALKQRGVKAEYFASTQTNKGVFSDAESGAFNLLYMTPERACSLSERFWKNLLNIGICLLAVDEAHCISEWGHDFRVEYKQLHNLRAFLSDVPFVGLTATATDKVRKDITISLKLKDPYIAVGSFDRPNIFYNVKPFNRSQAFLNELVGEISRYETHGGSIIIYCTTIKDTEQIFMTLVDAGLSAGMYHGQMGSKAREESHRAFTRDEIQVMVATVAFGMGVDKPNIRCVIHYGCPKSLESYYQESGRCGRDGLHSACWLYYSRGDFAKADFYCAGIHSEKQRKAVTESLMAAEKYCLLTTCRRRILLEYFGEEVSFTNCGKCDMCTTSRIERDLSRESFLLLSCVRSCGNCFGLKMPVDVLRGSRIKKILDNKFDKLPSYGMGKDYSPTWWKALAGVLINHGYLKENIRDVWRTLSVSPAGEEFLTTANSGHQCPLVLSFTSEMIKEEELEDKQHKDVREFERISSLEPDGFSEAENKLYQMLLETRKKLARKSGTAPYAICGDQTLRKITKSRPTSRARLANVDGVNQHLVTLHGDSILQDICLFCQQLNLSVDEDVVLQTATPRIACLVTPKNVTPAKHDAWRMWQMDRLSFQEIAKHPGRSAPIKEQTVCDYILEASREGCEVDWSRFCEEIGLTTAIMLAIDLAIKKVGSSDRLKPIKEELPEHISYLQIKTCMAMQDRGSFAEQLSSCNTTEAEKVSVGDAEMASPCNIFERGSRQTETNVLDGKPSQFVRSSNSHEPNCYEFVHSKLEHANDLSHLTSPTKKIRKEAYIGVKNDAFEASEVAMLEWLGQHDGVALSSVIQHFNGSKEETVVDLLSHLEGEFFIFKKNGLYKLM